jgi:hypothetical protein
MWYKLWIASLICGFAEAHKSALWLSLFPLQLWLVMLLLSLRLALRFLGLGQRTGKLEPWLADELSETELKLIAVTFLCFLARLGWWIFSHSPCDGVYDVSFVAFVLGGVALSGLSYIIVDLRKFLAIAKAKNSASAVLSK